MAGYSHEDCFIHWAIQSDSSAPDANDAGADTQRNSMVLPEAVIRSTRISSA